MYLKIVSISIYNDYPKIKVYFWVLEYYRNHVLRNFTKAILQYKIMLYQTFDFKV